MWLYCLIACIALLAASGVVGLFAGRRGGGAQVVATIILLIGALAGLATAIMMLSGDAGSFRLDANSSRVIYYPNIQFQIHGPLPDLALHFRLDPLGAFFLMPICLVGAMGSIYGNGYWPQERNPRTAWRLQLCYGLLLAAMALAVLAADGIAFLFAWELMALSAFFLICTEESKTEVREAGWLYFVCTHGSTLALFALFALLRYACGSFEFHAIAAGTANFGLRTAIFLTALFGFGVKAGMMPLHFWLPSAHANAPSHVSAVLSGVLLKMGIYGLLRTLTLLPAPPISLGALVLLLGTISAVFGVLFALGQHDLKRLLAYHSIENIGIVLMGLGLALIGEARGRPDWIVLGMAGSLLHVWNHALFKSLLFFAAGSAIHAVGTREIDLMGGLAKFMPKTAALFFLGAVAICGLPPLNGFVSEFFIYVGLFKSIDRSSGAALAAPALALVGALAAACFVKAYGAVFLGLPRQASHRRLHESPMSMIMPMAMLAVCCAAIGVFPLLTLRPLSAVIHQWSPTLAADDALGNVAPLGALTAATVSFSAAIIGGILLWRRYASVAAYRPANTWDCGYARPSARMQYTASSMAQALVDLAKGVLRPRVHEPRISAAFPSAATYESHVDDVVLDGFLSPLWRRFKLALGWLRVVQHGSVQAYVTYILIVLSFLLFLTAPVKEIIRAIVGGQVP